MLLALVAASTALVVPKAADAVATLQREVELIADLLPGTDHSRPSQLTRIGNDVYFSADFDGDNESTIGITDGTSAGTRSIVPASGPPLSDPSTFTQVGSSVFFVARTRFTGYELWVTDGTSAGTRQVKDIASGGADSFGTEKDFAVLGNRVYFGIGSALWSSDGTSAGTTVVTDIGGSIDNEFVELGGEILFAARDGDHGLELWKSNGTASGTSIVADAVAGPNGVAPEGFVSLGGRVFFRSAGHPDIGSELWVTDGTELGTKVVSDVRPGSEGSNPQHLFASNGWIYFTANDGTHGVELWKSDGTPTGTTMVLDVRQGSESSVPTSLTAVLDELFFSADDGLHGFELWKYSPATGAASLVEDIATGSTTNAFPSNIVAVDDVAYFEASDGASGGGLTGGELWRSDGTPEGTYRARDINPGSEGSLIEEMTGVGGSMYFSAFHPSYGIELWRADPPRLTLRVARVLEGDRGTRTLKVRARLSHLPDTPVELTFQTRDGRAKAGKDYLPVQGTLVFDEGQATASIPIQVVGDRRREGKESFAIVVGEVGRRPVVVRPAVNGPITDDD